MANNKIQIKRTNVSGRSANVSDVSNAQYIDAGELALNMADGMLYTSNGSSLITVGANQVNQRITNSLTLDNDRQLRFKTVNSSAYVYLVQQSDDNFVFYSTDAAYNPRAVFSIYANSSTSDFQFGQPVRFNSANVTFSGGTKLYANGSSGAAGQVLTSNSTGIYWAAVSGSGAINVNAQYVWSNLHTFQANVTFTGNTISLLSDTGSILLGGSSDQNWKIGRNTGATTKFYYTNNTVDIIAADSNLEGVAIGKPGGNTYLETGYAGTFTRLPIYVGNNTVNVYIDSTSFSGTANNSNYLGGITSSAYVQNADSRTLSGNLNFTAANVYFTNGLYVGTAVVANTTTLKVGNTKIESMLATIGGQMAANGSVGTSGQVLTSGASGNVYWSTISSGATNLSSGSNSSTVTILSDTGTDAIILAANSTTAGVITSDNQTIGGSKTFTSDASFGANVSVSGTVTSGTWNAIVKSRIVSHTDATSITINADTTDIATMINTQATGTFTINAPSGTVFDGQKLMLKLKSTNVQTFSWNAIFAGSVDAALPTASSGSSKTDYLGFIYDSSASKWHVIAKNFGY